VADLAGLHDAIEGDVLVPGSPGYDAAARPAMARFADVLPEAVVRCATPEDVVETIALARRSGLDLAIRGGGHCFAGRSSTRGLLLDVGPMSAVTVSNGIATIGAGARLRDVEHALDDHGLTIAGGLCPSVGISGQILGGGLGILGRARGLTADTLVEAQVVLAEGRIVDCDERRDADLYWGLRGAGGGQLGVVTRFVVKTVPDHVATCFRLTWPLERAGDVLEAWQAWSPLARDELAASLLVNAFADPDRPPVATVFGAMHDAEAETRDVLDELAVRVASEPSAATFAETTSKGAKRYLAEHAPGAEQLDGAGTDAPTRLELSRSEFFRRPLPADAIAALLARFAEARMPGATRELDFTPWGGAYNRVPTDATAFAHREELFLLKHAVTLPREPAAGALDAARDWLADSWGIVRPWGSGGVYPNFPDPDLPDPQQAYHGPNLARVRRVKATYDPDDVLRFHQSVRP
jgi:FAD/FMN-containing dehydrogenase